MWFYDALIIGGLLFLYICVFVEGIVDILLDGGASVNVRNRKHELASDLTNNLHLLCKLSLASVSQMQHSSSRNTVRVSMWSERHSNCVIKWYQLVNESTSKCRSKKAKQISIQCTNNMMEQLKDFALGFFVVWQMCFNAKSRYGN